MTALALFLSLASRLRHTRPTCDSLDPSRCVCGGWSRGHGVALALYRLAPVMRDRRRPAEFAIVPSGRLLWGSAAPRSVRCHDCGAPLRAGARGPVTREGARWRHGPAVGRCLGRAKVPRGGRSLEKLLRESVKEVRSGAE